MSTLTECFRWHRQHGASPAAALVRSRDDVAAGRTRYPLDKPHRAAALGEPFTVWSTVLRYAERPAAVGLRLVDYSDGIVRSIDHTGWWTDADGDNGRALRGAVYQLPADRDGRERYVPGYVVMDGGPEEAAAVALGEMVDDKDTAARIADSIAGHAAEAEREYDAAWQAGSRWAALGEDIASAVSDARALLAEWRRVRRSLADAPAIVAAVKARLCARLAEAREARAERQMLAEGDYVAEYLPGFWIGNPRLCAAFNDGAGAAVL